MTETITRILVPVDFSPHADRALRYAATLAHRLGATLALVHVIEDPFVTGAWTSEVYVPSFQEVRDQVIADAERKLAMLRDSVAAMDVSAETSVTTGWPVQAIIDHAAQGGFDLIVMGTHGRTGLTHAVMGSVAERVLRRAPCPVLTVRGTEAAAANATPTAA